RFGEVYDPVGGDVAALGPHDDDGGARLAKDLVQILRRGRDNGGRQHGEPHHQGEAFLHDGSILPRGRDTTITRNVNRQLRGRAATTEGAPGEDARVLAAVDDDFSIHDHVVDADRKLFGPGARRRRLHRPRIEHHEVRLEAVAQKATI